MRRRTRRALHTLLSLGRYSVHAESVISFQNNYYVQTVKTDAATCFTPLGTASMAQRTAKPRAMLARRLRPWISEVDKPLSTARPPSLPLALSDSKVWQKERIHLMTKLRENHQGCENAVRQVADLQAALGERL